MNIAPTKLPGTVAPPFDAAVPGSTQSFAQHYSEALTTPVPIGVPGGGAVVGAPVALVAGVAASDLAAPTAALVSPMEVAAAVTATAPQAVTVSEISDNLTSDPLAETPSHVAAETLPTIADQPEALHRTGPTATKAIAEPSKLGAADPLSDFQAPATRRSAGIERKPSVNTALRSAISRGGADADDESREAPAIGVAVPAPLPNVAATPLVDTAAASVPAALGAAPAAADTPGSSNAAALAPADTAVVAGVATDTKSVATDTGFKPDAADRGGPVIAMTETLHLRHGPAQLEAAALAPADGPVGTAAPTQPAVPAAPTFAARLAATYPVVPAAPNAPVVDARSGTIGRDMGVEIARLLTAGRDELTVRLNPAEMGRVEVRMGFDENGSIRAVVAAESPAALDLLRRDAGDLARALGDAGIRSDAQSFRFDARSGDGGQSGQRSPHGGRHPNDHLRSPHLDGDQDTPVYHPLRTSGRVDLMA
jgi:flagellar hook-length control protein FliK